MIDARLSHPHRIVWVTNFGGFASAADAERDNSARGVSGPHHEPVEAIVYEDAA